MPMIEQLLPAAALLMLSTMVQPATAQTTPRSTATSTSDTVLVAPPTGDRAADRASIEAALGAVQPGGTVQFAPGTYLVGEFIRVSVPRVTLQGHVDGTTLRGCEPERFDLPDGFGMEEVGVVAMDCTGLYLIADRQTVRGLTFEHAWQALWIGCCLDPAEEGEAVEPSHVGGHLIEGNTFRASVNGFRVIGDSPEPVVIRDNDFVNVWHAGAVNGGTAHILGNRISVPDAAQVPPNGFPGLALVITPYDTRLERAFTCAGNVIAGNRVEGHPEGIAILAIRAGASCRENVIHDNTIRVERVRFTGTPWGVTGIGDPADSTLAGVPIALSDLSAQMSEIFGVPAEPVDEVLIQDNLLEGNRIVGAEGLGIEILVASDNRIVGNTITRVAVRDPFPGNTMYVPPPWGEANGSGIWLSPGSDGNEIVGNAFENVAGAVVFLEGDDNRVELRSPTDSVHGLGTDNEVSVADGAEGSDVATAERIAAAADTVHVAPPTGDRETDRSNVLAALEEVQPGGTILFAQGTYLIGGEIIRVTIPRITLLGHPEGTTLRGCDPGEFPWDDLTEFGNNCNAIELAAGQQTVRNLTFEHAMWALHVGCCWDGRPGFEAGDGGHLIEGNTFRNSSNGVRVHGFWTEPTVIRNNRFLNNWHSVAIYGNTVHLLDNDISAPEPEKVQLLGFPGDAIHIGPPATLHGSVQGGTRTCENNVVAGNRIDGTTEGIMVMADDETPCRNNVIRDNTIAIRRARPAAIPGFISVHDDTDETVVGVPLALRGAVVDNLIEGNVIDGAEGLGIEIRHASRNRIVSNTVTRVLRREPFRGNAIVALPILGGEPNAWRAANGSGIWVSPGSDGNEIVGNTFEEVAGAEVFLEGDDNRVELLSASDSVRDLGRGNGVIVAEAPPDTTRYTVIIDGHAKAEWRMWQEDSVTWRYEYEGEAYDSYHFPRSERLVLDSDGLPVELEIMGQKLPWAAWEERFESEGGLARWTTTVDEGERSVDGPRHYYAALHPVHDRGVLVRALLRRPSGRVQLLPDGEARLEALGERSIATEKGTRTVGHYAIHGLDLKPAYVWLDESGATFADEWSVLSGWEAAFPELRAATEAALAEHHHGLARSLVPPARERPLAITGARLFDPETHAVRAGTTILIAGNRIAAVGADGSVEAPPGAEVIEAAGRMVLPGLWDMHAHHGIPSVYLEMDAPLHLAGGITTARDLGSHTAPILSLKQRIEARRAIGPRLLLAGFIEGAGGRPSGVLVESVAEAEAAVDRFAELGFVQIKIYEQVPSRLVPVIIERAAHHGLRVSGHITHSMSGREAVEAGYDEIQHIAGIMTGMLGSSAELMERVEDGWTGWSEALADLQPGTESISEFVALLAAHGVAIDPTLAGTEAREVPPDYVAPVLDRLPPQAHRRILDRFWNRHPEMLPHQDGIVSSRRGFIRVAHEAGIPVLPGTDIIPGFGYHRELELYVEAGIPAPEVLTLATLGAARVMRMDDELGSIEPGKLADLILVDGDPTANISDIRRVVTVIKDGRVYDPAAIYRALGIEPCCEE